jgi:hypothetical protein
MISCDSLIALFLTAAMALVAPSPQNPAPADPCKCAVVNKPKLIDADCKCELEGVGEVPAFDSTTPVFPDGVAAPGVCSAAPCTGNNQCTFKAVATTVTIAACARKCTGHEDTDPCVSWARRAFPEAGGVGSTGCHAFGGSVEYIAAAPGANHRSCGGANMEDTITFYKVDGTIAFKLVFTFSCGSCRAARP